MSDNNLSSSITALVNQIKTEIPTSSAENLKRLARSIRKLGHSGDSTIDTLINTRANALVASATPSELQILSEAVNLVDDTSNPTAATNVNADVHVSDTAPASAVSGDLWWKTDELNLYIYYEDTDGAQWIQANSTVITGTIPTDVSDLTDSTNLLNTDVSDLTDTTSLLGSGGATVYANMAALIAATGMSNGDLALVTASNNMYIYNTPAWFLIATVTNAAPSAITDINPTYVLTKDGTATVITATSTDPEGLDITWSYAVTSGSLGTTATVSQNENVFTITPGTNDPADVGTFELTFSVTDGVSTETFASTFTLVFTNEIKSIIGASVTSTTNYTAPGSGYQFGSIVLSPDGTKMIWGRWNANCTMWTFDLSTPYDTSTSTRISTNSVFPPSGSSNGLIDLYIDPTGYKIYALKKINGGKLDFGTMTTAWDPTTITWNSTGWTPSQRVFDNQTGTYPGEKQGFFWSHDGLNIYTTSGGWQYVTQYTCSTAWDLSTASYTAQKMDPVGSALGSGMISETGERAVILNHGKQIRQYDMSTPYNISTASMSNGSVRSVPEADNGLWWDHRNGDKFYIMTNIDMSSTEYIY